jgi:hypothetical protein
MDEKRNAERLAWFTDEELATELERRRDYKRDNPVLCDAPECVRLLGHDGFHQDRFGWSFVWSFV